MSSHTSQKDIPKKQLRQFGWLMGGVFAIICLWPLVFRGEGIRMWAGIIAGIFGILGMVFPNGLTPVYRAWMIFGEKIGWLNFTHSVRDCLLWPADTNIICDSRIGKTATAVTV